MEKQSFLPVSESVLVDWRLRMDISHRCYQLARELGRYFVGFEELRSSLVSASIDLERLAYDVLPFDVICG